MRVALLGATAFVVGTLVTAWGLGRAELARDVERSKAANWAFHLMRDSQPTRYGWIPSDEATRFVDQELANAGAAFVLLDQEDRLVRSSRQLSMAAVPSLPAKEGDAFVWDPLGRVLAMRIDVSLFGQSQGTFLLLHKEGVSIPAAPAAARGHSRDPSLGPIDDWGYVALGAVLVAVILFLGVEFLVASRLRRMTRLAASASALSGTPRRFDDHGSDELGALAAAFGAYQRRVHRLASDASERERNRRDWLSELSHDLKTPLAALQLRLENARDNDRDELRRAVAAATKDCERIQILARGFMDLAALEVTDDYAREPVLPEELVGRVVRGLKPIADDAGVSLTRGSAEQPTIVGDGHRLLRALENLTRNAIRHAHTRVELSIEHSSEFVYFRVADDGGGFEALPAGTRIDYYDWVGRRASTGLGLRVAGRVAHAHGGELSIENLEDRGAVQGSVVTCSVELIPWLPHDDAGTDRIREDGHA